MAACGLEVLLVDLTRKAMPVLGLALKRKDRPIAIASLPVRWGGEAILPTLVPGLSILPAVMDLSAAEVELSDLDGRNFACQGFRKPEKAISLYYY